MNFHELRAYLLSHADVCEQVPFGPRTLVYKVRGAVFALLVRRSDGPASITLRCKPEHADLLRGIYPSVRPSIYMNQRGWNMVALDGSVGPEELCDMVDASYALALRSPEARPRAAAPVGD